MGPLRRTWLYGQLRSRCLRSAIAALQPSKLLRRMTGGGRVEPVAPVGTGCLPCGIAQKVHGRLLSITCLPLIVVPAAVGFLTITVRTPADVDRLLTLQSSPTRSQPSPPQRHNGCPRHRTSLSSNSKFGVGTGARCGLDNPHAGPTCQARAFVGRSLPVIAARR